MNYLQIQARRDLSNGEPDNAQEKLRCATLWFIFGTIAGVCFNIAATSFVVVYMVIINI